MTMFQRGFVLGVILTSAIWFAIVVTAAGAHAAPDPSLGPNCDTVLWGFLGSQRRSICDGPLRADGSWDRKRSVWVPAHTVPLTTYCSGGSSYTSCSTSGGYFVPFTLVDQQVYPVTADTVLPDEPGHLGGPQVVA